MRPLRVEGPVEPRAIFDPERSCNTIRSFTVTLTGNIHLPPVSGGTWQAVWTPTKGTTFRLKGWRCQAYVYTTLAGAAATYGNLAFFDCSPSGTYSSPGDIVCHVSAGFLTLPRDGCLALRARSYPVAASRAGSAARSPIV
jgi:hypothetical protein